MYLSRFKKSEFSRINSKYDMQIFCVYRILKNNNTRFW